MNHRVNNFDALRLLGALLVAFSHTIVVIKGFEPLGDATHKQSFGGVGLNIFCVISGFLITKSGRANKRLVFFEARVLRIFPALFVAIPLMALVFGPVLTSLPLASYFTTPQLWHFLGSMLVLPLNPVLPGVVNNAPMVAQLYSLTAELAFYIVVGLLASWRHFPKFVLFLCGLVFAGFCLNDYESLPFTRILSVQADGMTLLTFPARLGLTCVYYLLAGSVIALFVSSPQRLAPYTPLLLAVWIYAFTLEQRHLYDVVEMVIFPLLVIGVAYATRFRLAVPSAIGDLSYGIYIWHFFIAEVVLFLRGGGYYSVAIALVLSAAVGWLSFRLIEGPALAMRRGQPKVATDDQAPMSGAALG